MGITSGTVELVGLRLRDDFDDKEPRIRDLELAKRLGFARPRKIRETIHRLHSTGKLNGIAQRPVVGRREDGMPNAPANEYWLDERSCLKVIAKSETDLADAILDEIIDVFMAYRRGKLLPRLLADEPCVWDPMWTRETVSALCNVYGWNYTPGTSMPAPLASIMAKIYRIVLEPDNYDALKGKNPEPCRGQNHHQWLTEQARERFRKELYMITGFAIVSCEYEKPAEAFWLMLERHYLNHPMQLTLLGIGTRKVQTLRASEAV